MFRRIGEFSSMTVAEALAAHAGAQMAAARAADEARRVIGDLEQVEVLEEGRSFVDSWGVSATVIGFSRPN
jgi:hypothetical protein